MSKVIIRKAQSSDCAQLLKLMLKLAEFEGYLDDFKVTETDLLLKAFNDKPDFYAFVAEVDKQLVGMLVYYYLPFTYDLKPWMLVKELYVSEDYRADGIGKSLMQAASIECLKVGASRMKWEVLTDNRVAKNFYLNLGAELTVDWQSMNLTEIQMKKLLS